MQPVAETSAGRVRGFAEQNGVLCFRGIPYGAPPVGEAAFLPPRPAPAWTGVREATEWGQRSRQTALPVEAMSGADAPDVDRDAAAARARELYAIAGGDYLGRAGDDCLNLNVWTPALDGAKRPVMVWFHGGGYVSGSANNASYLGDHLARRGDVVVVGVNHRLGAIGFLHLADLGGPKWAGSGNAGVLDLVEALRWVRDNIAAFGGDPNRVMIFGQSGGGGKVSTLLAMPAAKGLFHRAAIQSGPGLRALSAETATALAAGILQELEIGRGEIEKLQGVHPRALSEAAARANKGAGARMLFGPVMDGSSLPTHPFDPVAAPTQHDVPVIVGCTPDEFTFFQAFNPRFGDFTMDEVRPKLQEAWGERTDEFVQLLQKERPDWTPSLLAAWAASLRFQAGSFLLAERKAAAGGAPAYAYLLSLRTPVLGGVMRAPHNLCIPIVFDNMDRAPYMGGDVSGKAAESAMCDAWIAFARTGDPNHPGMPQWRPYEAKQRLTMVFDKTVRLESDPESAIRLAFADMPVGL